MHFFSKEKKFYGGHGIVGGQIGLGAGIAFAEKYKGSDAVTICFFGDGAARQGLLHETFNMAMLWKLPVVFVCENNFYASHMALLQRRAKDNILEAAHVHGLAGERLDGNDAVLVFEKAREAVRRARNGEGPTLLECRTYRWRGHVGPSWDMDVGVQRKDELKDWLGRDPIQKLRSDLLAIPGMSDRLSVFDEVLERQVEEAIVFARASRPPAAGDLDLALFHENDAEATPCVS